MWPTHLNEGMVEGDHFFGADEESGKFVFGGGRCYKLDDLCDGEDGSIL